MKLKHELSGESHQRWTKRYFTYSEASKALTKIRYALRKQICSQSRHQTFFTFWCAYWRDKSTSFKLVTSESEKISSGNEIDA